MSFRGTIPIVLLQFLLLTALNFNPSSALNDVEVTDETLRSICMKTIDYYFCRTTFRMWDGLEHADIYELSNVAILSAKIQARLNKHLVKIFIDNDLYPKVKSQLEECYVDYNVTLGKLELAYRYSEQKDCLKSKNMVKDAMKMSVKCETAFVKSVDIPNPIEHYSFDMETRNHIALVVLSELC